MDQFSQRESLFTPNDISQYAFGTRRSNVPSPEKKVKISKVDQNKKQKSTSKIKIKTKSKSG